MYNTLGVEMCPPELRLSVLASTLQLIRMSQKTYDEIYS